MSVKHFCLQIRTTFCLIASLMKRWFLVIGIAVLVGVPCDDLQASLAASDSQADPVYSTWDPGDNGGTGWGGGWTFFNQSNVILTTNNNNRGWFVSSSLNNNSPSGSDSN